MSYSDTINMLRLIYDGATGTVAKDLFLVWENRKSITLYGVVSASGENVIPIVHTKDSINIVNSNSSRPETYIQVRDTLRNEIFIYRVIRRENYYYLSKIYRSKDYRISRIVGKSLLICNSSGAFRVLSLSGRQYSKREYLHVIEHKTCKKLIGVHFLTVENHSVSKYVDILTLGGMVLEDKVKWTEEKENIYHVSAGTLYSRNLRSIGVRKPKGSKTARIQLDYGVGGTIDSLSW